MPLYTPITETTGILAQIHNRKAHIAYRLVHKAQGIGGEREREREFGNLSEIQNLISSTSLISQKAIDTTASAVRSPRFSIKFHFADLAIDILQRTAPFFNNAIPADSRDCNISYIERWLFKRGR